MSRKLALSSAVSILMMAAYALLGQQATRVPLAGEAGSGVTVEAPSLQLPAPSLPGLR